MTNKLFNELKNNKRYMIPSVLFVLSSLLHLLRPINDAWPAIGLLFQMIFGIWVIIVAIKNNFTIWPILIFGLISLIIGFGFSANESDNMKNAQKAYISNDFITAKINLENITDDETKQSQEYKDFLKNLNDAILKQNLELIDKATKEYKQNKIQEAKNTLSSIIDQDNSNKELQVLLAKIDKVEEIQKKEDEKHINFDNQAVIKKLQGEINGFIKNKQFNDARKNIDTFLENNTNIKKDNSIIISLLKKIAESENDAEIAKKNALINTILKDAKALYNKKKYQDSISKLEELLQIDKSHKEANKLIITAKKNLEIEKKNFWDDVKVIGILILAFIFWIVYKANKDDDENVIAETKSQGQERSKNSKSSPLKILRSGLQKNKPVAKVQYYCKKGNGQTFSQCKLAFDGHSESAVLSRLRKKHPGHEIIIKKISWED